jgi:phosphoglycerate dehydrogenase-like enzyme
MEQNKGIIALIMEDKRVPEGTAERISEAGDGREVKIVPRGRELEGVLDDIEILFGHVPFGMLPQVPHLAWVQLWSAGVDRLQKHPEVKKLPFLLTSASGIHGNQMAEHLFALILAWNRSLPAAFEARKKHEWTSFADHQISVLSGKTMLIAGYGAIGASVAHTALSFGMKVIALRRTVSKGGVLPQVVLENASRLADFLPEADYVVNILPATADTFHIFGKTEFSLMKQSAVYANIGRGATTDEAALIEALKERRIAAALLDVTETEPLPSQSPLWDLDTVLLTCHYAGMHPDYDRFALEAALDNLRRYVRGEALRNLIDKEQGY